MNKLELENLVEIRIKEADVLMNSGCFVEGNKAKDLYEAITDNKSGILAWLKKYW